MSGFAQIRGCGVRRYGGTLGCWAWTLWLAHLSSAVLACVLSTEQGVFGQVPVSEIRSVRVLIASGAEQIRFRANSAISVEDDKGPTLVGASLVASRDPAAGILIGDVSYSVEAVTLRPKGSEAVSVSLYRDGEWSPVRMYPGVLRLLRGEERGLDLVNLVDAERYVACVVASEVWPTFETEAYRAQAVAARTFVLYQMQRRTRASFDVGATQGSQVYRGIRTDQVGRRASDAAEYTRGIVLSWRDGGEDRLFCSYYSAACGGVSQSAAIFGKGNDIEPLRGGVRCDECRIAPGDTYRWGPERLAESEVRSRLVSAYPKLGSLGRIRKIKVAEKTASGRPVRLQITGSGGESSDMLAERFRLAVSGSLIKSTHFKIHVKGGEVIFKDGRGFGHGLGLCQWGMQGRALKGWRAGEILRYYYPGSKLTRVY